MTADPIARGAALDFVLTLRRRWADTVYPQLRREYEAAPARRVGPGHDGDHLVAGRDERLQRRQGDGGCSGEDDTHGDKPNGQPGRSGTGLSAPARPRWREARASTGSSR